MLVLTRKNGEAIRIGGRINVVVLSASRGQVRLGIEAPTGVSVLREEVHVRIAEANREAALGDVAGDEASAEAAERPEEALAAEGSR